MSRCEQGHCPGSCLHQPCANRRATAHRARTRLHMHAQEMADLLAEAEGTIAALRRRNTLLPDDPQGEALGSIGARIGALLDTLRGAV